MSDWEIIQGDCREVLAGMPSESVQMVCTSPPYWGLRDYGLEPLVWGGAADCEHLWGSWTESHDEREATTTAKSRTTDRFYGDESRRFDGNHQKHTAGQFCRCGAWRGSLGLEPTPELYVEHLVEIFREARRVLRSDGTVWLNMGDCYAGSWSGNSMRPQGGSQRPGQLGFQALEDTGYPSRSGNVPAGLKPKDLVMMPARVAMALQADGWWLRSDIVWAKPNPMPESVTDRPTRSHEFMFLLTKSARYFYDATAIAEGLSRPELMGTLRNRGTNRKGNNAGKLRNDGDRVGVPYAPHGSRNKRSVWTVTTEPFPSEHFAVFPTKLVEPCILAGTSKKGACAECGAPWERVVERTELQNQRKAPGQPSHLTPQGYLRAGGSRCGDNEAHTTGWQPTCDCDAPEDGEHILIERPDSHIDKLAYPTKPCLVLDPFCGAGTTGLVALRHSRRFVGIDLNPSYVEMARNCIDADCPLFNRP